MSGPAAAQPRGERSLVLGQASLSPVRPLDSLAEGVVRRAQLLDTLPQGFGLLALVPPCAAWTAHSRSPSTDPPTGLFSSFTLSTASRQVHRGWFSVPGSTTTCSPSITTSTPATCSPPTERASAEPPRCRSRVRRPSRSESGCAFTTATSSPSIRRRLRLRGLGRTQGAGATPSAASRAPSHLPTNGRVGFESRTASAAIHSRGRRNPAA